MEVLLLLWVGCAVLGGWIASEKGRPVGEGIMLGLLLSVIGLVIETLLPNPTPVEAEKGRVS